MAKMSDDVNRVVSIGNLEWVVHFVVADEITHLRARIEEIQALRESEAKLDLVRCELIDKQEHRIAELEAELEEERHPTKYHDIDDLYPPDECPHGSLRRSCEICERDERIREQGDALEALDRMIDEDSRRRQEEIDRLRADLSDSSAEIVMNHEEIAHLRARIAELEAALSKSIMHQKELDRCVHLTEEQIDEAWRLHGPAVGTTALCVFRDLGIVACEKCDGSGEVPTPETYAIETDGWDEACRDCKGHGWIWSIDGGNND